MQIENTFTKMQKRRKEKIMRLLNNLKEKTVNLKNSEMS